MTDNDIMNGVGSIMNMIKGLDHREKLIKKTKKGDFEKVENDIVIVNKAMEEFNQGKTYSLEGLQSIKIEIKDELTLDTFENLLKYLNDVKLHLDKVYGDMLSIVEKARKEYKEQLSNKGYGIFHEVADVMVHTFNF